jgi:hypothetical protein
MKNNFRSEITKQINNITSLFFLYSILTISLSPSFFFKRQTSLNENIGFFNKSLEKEKEVKTMDQKMLLKKIHFDLYTRNVLNSSENNFATRISINKEGKIIGYKPTKLSLLSYSLERQLIILLKKNLLIDKSEKSIYWLDITNKY